MTTKKMVDIYIPPQEDDGYIMSPNKCFRCAIIAPSNSGKSFLISKLLLSPHPYLHKAFYKVNFIDPTFNHTNQNNPYQYLDIDESQVYDEPDDETISEIFNSIPRDPNNDKVLPSLLVCDDTGQMKGTGKGSLLAKKLFIKARHYGVSILGSFQKMSFLPRPVRQSLSHIILFRSQNRQMIEEFCDEFMPFSKETNLAIIKYATTPDEEHPYPFLFCDLVKGEYYKGFDTKIRVDDFD